MQLAENRSALRTPGQTAAGRGARQRRSPTGGAAKGIPLKTVMEEAPAAPPATSPLFPLTDCGSAANDAWAAIASARKIPVCRFTLSTSKSIIRLYDVPSVNALDSVSRVDGTTALRSNDVPGPYLHRTPTVREGTLTISRDSI